MLANELFVMLINRQVSSLPYIPFSGHIPLLELDRQDLY